MEEVKKRPSFFKRTMIVDRKTQYAILFYSMLVAMMTVLLTGIFFVTLQSASTLVDPTASSFTYFLIIALLWAVVMICLALLGILLSHRIAGPVHRMRVHMQKVAEGGVIEELKLRKDDHFMDLADDYNKVLERLRRAETR